MFVYLVVVESVRADQHIMYVLSFRLDGSPGEVRVIIVQLFSQVKSDAVRRLSGSSQIQRIIQQLGTSQLWQAFKISC